MNLSEGLLRSVQVCDDTSALKDMGMYLPRSVYIQQLGLSRGNDLIITKADERHDLVSLVREAGHLDARAAGKEPDLDNFNLRKPFQGYAPVLAIEVIPLGRFRGLSVSCASVSGGRTYPFGAFLTSCWFSPKLYDPLFGFVRGNPFSSDLLETAVRYLRRGVELKYAVDFDPSFVADPALLSGDLHRRIANRVAGEFKVLVVDPRSGAHASEGSMSGERCFI